MMKKKKKTWVNEKASNVDIPIANAVIDDASAAKSQSSPSVSDARDARMSRRTEYTKSHIQSATPMNPTSTTLSSH